MSWLPYILAFVCLGLPSLLLAVCLWDAAKADRFIKELHKSLPESLPTPEAGRAPAEPSARQDAGHDGKTNG